jgi:hypothetical protein
MKMTLLEAVQRVLSVLEFDPVNDIGDTVESMQVAEECREAYMNLMSHRDWPHLCFKGSFDGLGDLSNPTTMRIPQDVSKIKWVRYNNKEVTYVEPEEFQDMVAKRIGLPNVNTEGFLTNKDPTYWTTYDDTIYVDKGFKVLVPDTNVIGNIAMKSDTLWYPLQFLRDSTWTNVTQPLVDDNSIRTFTGFIGDAELLRIRMANDEIVAGRVFKFYAILSRKR